MSAQHTPGPWALASLPCKSARNKLGLVAGDRRLCDLLVYDDADEANARLIAAAPDLLAALEKIRDLVSDQPGSNALAIAVIASVAVTKAECE